MPITVAAFYQFAALPDFRELREPLRAICADLELKGSVLLAHEGINGTLAGGADAIDALIAELREGELFGGRLDNLELKFSRASAMPFARLKIRLKKEIVTLGDSKADPTKSGGRLCRCRRLERIDRGTGYAGDRHPQRLRGGDGQSLQARSIPASKVSANSRISRRARSIHRSTGRSRCSAPAASAARRPVPISLSRGFAEVYHLKGGILKYLEAVPESESRWRGECFVFDERIALGHGLRERDTEDACDE